MWLGRLLLVCQDLEFSCMFFLTLSKWDMGGGSVLQITLQDHSSCRSYMIIATIECLMGPAGQDTVW